MSARDLLFEIGTEELPPKALAKLSAALEEGICAGLTNAQLQFDGSQRFATPRRLAVLVRGLQECQADRSVERVGPALKAAFDDHGNPTAAAKGFAKSCGVEVAILDTREVDGVEKLAFARVEPGRPALDLIPDIIEEALRTLPIPKRMRWGSSREEFVRPVHWVVLVFGEEVIPMVLLGVEAANLSFGHRFHNNHEILIESACDYEELLEETGGVIPDFAKRRELVKALVEAEGQKAGARTIVDEDLLDEVTSLVEYPVALSGRFDEHFLEVPPEALILAMKSHQKCFYLVDNDNMLLPGFVTVSNLLSKDPAQVIEGNERVIRPRLADARFFFETDRQHRLESRLEKLGTVVFQEKLGTIFDKTERVASLAGAIAEELDANVEYCRRAARLSKCDLLTNMVGEFADLQGVMGCYYARHDGEPEEVSQALTEQYLPRFAGDSLPAGLTGCVLAIADKLDTMVGMFGIGQPPTGSRDPFALRRAAIGILRIMVEKELMLDLRQCIASACAGFDGSLLAADTAEQVFDFMLERFRAWHLDKGVSSDVFQAVFALRPSRPLDFHRRVKAVSDFNQLPEAQALAAANKRVSNLLSKQEGQASLQVDDSRLEEPAEKHLHQEIAAKVLEVAPLFDAGRYGEGLSILAGLKHSVDTFFDEVLVICDDTALRENRLALLQQLRGAFLEVADISQLHSG